MVKLEIKTNKANQQKHKKQAVQQAKHVLTP